MLRKSSIETVFIYAISAIVVILILYFGYRGVTGFQKANDEGIIERTQMRMTSDISELSIHYGSTAKMSYDLTKNFNRICFVDLNLDPINASKRDYVLNQSFPLIMDSVQSNSTNNVFFVGGGDVVGSLS